MSRRFFTVRGSYGNLEVDVQTGMVTDYSDAGPEYDDIVRFDMQELRGYYGNRVIASGETDILDIRFWDRNGIRTEPAETYRDWSGEQAFTAFLEDCDYYLRKFYLIDFTNDAGIEVAEFKRLFWDVGHRMKPQEVAKYWGEKYALIPYKPAFGW